MDLKAYASLKRAGIKIRRDGKVNVKDVHAAVEVLSASRSGAIEFPVEITSNPDTKKMIMHLGPNDVDVTGTLDIADEAFAVFRTQEFDVQLWYRFPVGRTNSFRDPLPDPDDVEVYNAQLSYDGKTYALSDKCLALKVGKYTVEENFIDRIIDHERDNDEDPDYTED